MQMVLYATRKGVQSSSKAHSMQQQIVFLLPSELVSSLQQDVQGTSMDAYEALSAVSQAMHRNGPVTPPSLHLQPL